MQDSTVIVSHALVEHLPHVGVRESVVDVEFADIEHLDCVLGVQVLEDFDKFLAGKRFFKWLDLIQCLDVENVSCNTGEFEDE